jgi:hypothetical protein
MKFLQTTSKKVQLLLGTMLVVCCFFSHTNDDEHGGRWGNIARALTRWRRLVASCQSIDALHWAMFIVLYRPGGMVIKFAVKFVTFFILYIRVKLEKNLFLPHF